MNESFRDWLFGAGVFFIAAFVLYIISMLVSPYKHLSFLESWGIIMMLVILRSGYIEYIREEEDE